uniref:DUF3615 domain-containing protein n=1 Tax=Zea mays TaxID=4577 RepID=A0A804UFT7_MAIZE
MKMGSMGMDFVVPALEELLSDLSREEQLRLQNKAHGHDCILKPHNKHAPRLRPSSFSEWYGGEFDDVKPLKQSRVGFRGQAWFHINFWARPRSSSSSNNKTIKRFFAEVHYKPTLITSPSSSSSSLAITAVSIVEICIIIGAAEAEEGVVLADGGEPNADLEEGVAPMFVPGGESPGGSDASEIASDTEG